MGGGGGRLSWAEGDKLEYSDSLKAQTGIPEMGIPLLFEVKIDPGNGYHVII